jgi:hypothetical protein
MKRLLLVMGFLACSEAGISPNPPPPPPPPGPGALVAVTPLTRSGIAGESIPVSVRVNNTTGTPVSGVIVTFAVTIGGGTVTPASSVTGGGGEASATWTLGALAGPNILSAGLGSLTPVLFGATGFAGAAASVTVHAGANQTSTVGAPVPVRPAVLVRDANGNPVAGITVTFGVGGGGGSLSGSSPETDGQGVATVGAWILATTAGPGSLTALVPGLPAAAFAVIGVPDVPATLTAAAGLGQSDVVGVALPVRPAVVVRDRFGNPVAGAAVVFSVTGGGGQVSDQAVLSTGDGLATSAPWILGNQHGPQTLVATLTGLAPVAFTATALSRPSLTIEIAGYGNARDPDGFSVTIGQSVGQLPWNSSTTLTGLLPGEATVVLNGVASHCSVDPGPRIATLMPGGVHTVRVGIGCFGDFAFNEVLPASGGEVRIRYMDTDGVVHALTSAIGRHVIEAWSPDGERIVYRTNERGMGSIGLRDDLAVVSRSGGIPMWIATGFDDEGHARWSPDGTRLVYARHYFSPDVGSAIHTVNADGTGDVELLPGQHLDVDPDWILDGTDIAFGCIRFHPLGGICRTPSGGGNVSALIPSMPHALSVTASPQGDMIHFVGYVAGDAENWVVSVTGGTPVRLAPGLGGSQVVWSPDGNKLAFFSREPGNRLGLRVVDRTGANLTGDLIPFSTGVSGASWSPDGRWLMVSANDLSGRHVYVMRPNGSLRRQVTFGPSVSGVHWRPTSQFTP